MTHIPFDAIGFDLDGTLVDSHRDLGNAVNHALELGGFEQVPVDSSKDLIGGGAKVMLARAIEQQGGLPDDEFRKLYKAMLRYYSAHCAVETRPYPYALEAMQALDEAGIAMAVVTNKFEGFAKDILTQIGLIDRFVAVIGGDSLGKGEDGNFRAKPLADPLVEAARLCESRQMAFVGDSSYDVAAARAAQMPVVVAAYGYCDKPPQELGGDAVIDSLDGLIPALKSL